MKVKEFKSLKHNKFSLEFQNIASEQTFHIARELEVQSWKLKEI